MLDGACSEASPRVREALRVDGWGLLTVFDDCAGLELDELEQWLFRLSAEVGHVVPQSHSGKLMAHIRDEGGDYSKHTTRGHQSNAELAFHSDRCDVNLLLYVRTAATGGELSVLTYAAAAARLQERDVAAYETLFEPFPFDLRDERIFEQPEWHCRPILWRTEEGEVRGHYIRRFIADSQRHADCPRLTERQYRALDAWDEVLAELEPSARFAPQAGQLLLLDTYRVMHARTQFVDDESSPRLALRTWVAPHASEALPPFLLPIAGSCAAGVFRGGVGKGEAYLARLGTLDQNLPE
jgi:hypothetical protein